MLQRFVNVVIACCMLVSLPANLFARKPAEAQLVHESGGEKTRSLDTLKEHAPKYLGIPYKRGGSSLKGFDCSGFTRFIYKTIFGFDLPHSSTSQYRSPLLVKVPHDDLQPGDLIFFASTPSKKRINHVGIYLDDNTFIHAELNRGITLSRFDDTHWKSRLVSIKRPVNLQGDQDSEDFFEAELSLHAAVRRPQTPGMAGIITTWYDAYPQSFYALSYTQSFSLTGLRLRLSQFFIPSSTTFDSLTAAPGFSFSLLPKQPSYQGHNMAAEFTPFNGLRISPFLTLYATSHHHPSGYTPAESAGINICLYPARSTTWLLATSLQKTTFRSTGRDSWDHYEKVSDWSLTYRYCFTPALHMSFTGEHIRYPFMTSTVDTPVDDQRFFFQLHVTY